MLNKEEMQTFRIDEMQWIKVHLRLAALEHSGTRLSYRFTFAPSLSSIVCRIYFSDNENNPISSVSTEEQRSIQEGWMHLAMTYILEALQSCGLPATFKVTGHVRFLLHVSEGMGTAIVREAEVPLIWPPSEAHPAHEAT